jgi:hypothetical protein
MKKAAKADQEGFPCLGLVGVEAWSKPRKKDTTGRRRGKHELLPDLAAVVWKGRPVTIVYDSDLTEKPEVSRAECSLAQALTAAGAKVKVVRLPHRPGGAKIGLDDFLVDRRGEALRLLIETARPPTPPDTKRPDKPPKPPSTLDLLVRLAAERCDVEGSTRTTLRHTERLESAPPGGPAGVPTMVGGGVLRPVWEDCTPGRPSGRCELRHHADLTRSDLPDVRARRRVRWTILLDLGDSTYRAVRITPVGWEIVNSPHPVRFLRPKTMHPLPVPEPGGGIDDFRSFLNRRGRVAAHRRIHGRQPTADRPIPDPHPERSSARCSGVSHRTSLISASASTSSSTSGWGHDRRSARLVLFSLPTKDEAAILGEPTLHRRVAPYALRSCSVEYETG